MPDGGPDPDPDYEARVEGDFVVFDDVVDGVVEEGDKTGDADDGDGLAGQGGEDDRGQSGGEESFVDAIEAAGVVVHVEDECKGWEEIDKVHADRCCEGAVIHAVSDIGPVVRESASDVVVHASAQA